MFKSLGIMGVVAVLTSSPIFAQTTWEVYLEYPSSQNAAQVDSLRYTESTDRMEDVEWDLSLLEVQVISCDREAVRLAFRLVPQMDGLLAEIIDFMLGRLIRINPTLFLQELKNHGEGVPSLGHHVSNFGEVYVDRWQAKEYEAEQRIQSLQTVVDSDLAEIRDECIAELRARLEDLR